MSSQAKIIDTPFEQKFFQPPEVGVLRWHGHTDRQTDGHPDSMTESAQWANSVKTPTQIDTTETSFSLVISIGAIGYLLVSILTGCVL